MLSEKLPWPRFADPELLADRAVRAVGCDEVLRADGPLGAAVARADDRRDAVVVLLDRRRLRRVLDARAESLRRAEQHRLEPDLRDEEPRRRADVLDALVDEAEVPVELLAAEALDGDDRAVLDELPRGRLLDLRLEADARGTSRSRAGSRARRAGGSPCRGDARARATARRAGRGTPPSTARRGCRRRSGRERRRRPSQENGFAVMSIAMRTSSAVSNRKTVKSRFTRRPTSGDSGPSFCASSPIRPSSGPT